jgi:hypothetical protein
MAATIGAIHAELSAETAAFQRDMGKAVSAAQSASAGINRAFATIGKGADAIGGSITKFVSGFFSIKGAIAGLVGGAAVGGIGSLIKSTVDFASELVDTSDRIGITTKTLQEYRYAASQTGVTQDVLDQSLAFFVKQLGFAREGTGSLYAYLKKTDPALLNLITHAKSSGEALSLMVEKAGGLKNAADQQALLAVAFGRTGTALGNLVPHVSELTAEAEKLHVVIGDQVLRSGEQLGDTLEKLGRVMAGQLQGAILQNADAINTLANSLIAAIPEVLKMTQGVLDFFGVVGSDRASQIASLERELTRLESHKDDFWFNVLDTVSGGGPALDAAIAEQKKKIINLENQSLKDPMVFSKPAEGAALFTTNLDELNASINKVVGSMSVPAKATAQRAHKETDAEKQAREDKARQDSLTAEIAKIESLNKVHQQLGTSVGLTGEALKQFTINETIATEAIDKGIDLTSTLGQEWESARREQLELADSTDTLSKSMQDLNDISQGIGESMADSLEKAVIEGGKLSGIIRDLAHDINQLVFRKLVTEPIADALTSGIKGIVSGFNTGSIGGTISSAIGALGFADGGRPPLHRASIVGERGPEFFVPDVAGTVVPMSELQSGSDSKSSSRSVQQVFNITTPDANSFRATQRQLARAGRRRLALPA